jgi:hypothetical protein
MKNQCATKKIERQPEQHNGKKNAAAYLTNNSGSQELWQCTKEPYTCGCNS